MASSRRALHQRSDSDTNVQAGATVSRRPSDVSLRPSRSSTASSSARNTNAKQHKSQHSFHSTTSGTTSRSNTVRSIASLDSLPPVPPLRIQKQQQQRLPSFGVFQEPGPAVHGYDYALQQPGNVGDVGLAGEHANSDEPQNAGTTSIAPSAATPLPRSILKRPSKAALPPYTEDDYRSKSTAWAAGDAQNLTPSRARMNAQTLRIVNTVETGAPGSDDDNDERMDRVEDSLSQGHPRHTRSGSLGASDVLSVSSARPGTPPQSTAIPAWARYFYGKRGGRTSVIDAQVTGSTSDQIGIALSSGPPGQQQQQQQQQRRPGTAGSMSIAEIPRYFRRPQRPGEADTTTLWSLPHLDHSPTARTETVDRQLVLFCLGFVLPFLWWIAALLPLPPELPSWRGDLEARGWNFTAPKEARQAEMAYERRYENARWWRQVNRTMSLLGLLIIAAIIALAIVSAHRS